MKLQTFNNSLNQNKTAHDQVVKRDLLKDKKACSKKHVNAECTVSPKSYNNNWNFSQHVLTKSAHATSDSESCIIIALTKYADKTLH